MAGGDVPVRPNYLGDARIDDVARMVFELTSELWVLKDRTMMLEALLVENGIIADTAVDTLQPTTELSMKLLAERKALVSRVYGAVLDSDARSAAALAR
jgi:hypothetical protein